MSTRLSRGRSTPAIRATRAPSYSCRCLCRGFVQMTRTRPWRRMILHRSHIFFTDGRTFIVRTSPSFVAVHDPAARQIVWRQFNQHPVPWEDPDVVHPHLSRDVSQNAVPVFELHPEHGVGERLGDRSLDLDSVLLRQALPSVPRRRTGPIPPRTSRNHPRDGGRQSVYGHPRVCVHAGAPAGEPEAKRAAGGICPAPRRGSRRGSGAYAPGAGFASLLEATSAGSSSRASPTTTTWSLTPASIVASMPLVVSTIRSRMTRNSSSRPSRRDARLERILSASVLASARTRSAFASASACNLSASLWMRSASDFASATIRTASASASWRSFSTSRSKVRIRSATRAPTPSYSS